MVRAIDKPSPIPRGFVVKNESKSLAECSGAIPQPRSLTVMTLLVAAPLDRHDNRPAILRHVVHRIHGVEHEDDEHLLHLREIAFHEDGRRRQPHVERDLTLPRLCAQKSRGVADRGVEIESLPHGLVLGEECTQPADDIACAQVVAPDSRHDSQEVLAAIGAGLEKQIGRVRTGLYRTQRLVDLVRDRCRQFTRHRKA